MKKSGHFESVFACVLLLFCLALIVWVPLRGILDARLTEASLSLETSQGRERKQEYEYAQVSEELPATRARLEETQPLADAAAEEVAALKARRKELRAEKKHLEALLNDVPEEQAGTGLSESSGTGLTEGGGAP